MNISSTLICETIFVYLTRGMLRNNSKFVQQKISLLNVSQHKDLNTL